MKKVSMFSFLVLIYASSVFADFSPVIMKFSTPDMIQYSFDGTNLEIPFTVAGTSANMLLCVTTKDKGENISVHNGYLGWHYANMVDTSIYISTLAQYDLGDNTIAWDGKDSDGNAVPAGEYYYYLWGYDNANEKTLVMDHSFYPYCNTYIEEMGEDGLPLENPIHMLTTSTLMAKWQLGNDPADSTLIDKSEITVPENWNLRAISGVLDPNDHNYYYVYHYNKETASQGIFRYQWVPGGMSVPDQTWGDNGSVSLFIPDPYGSGGSGVLSDGSYLYAGAGSDIFATTGLVSFYAVSLEGELVKEFDMSEWWVDLNDFEAGGQANGIPQNHNERNGRIFMGSHGHCLKSCVDPGRAMDDDEAFFVWNNGNGDYINDHNFEDDATKPWVCFDFNVGPYAYTIDADNNFFSITPSYDMGAVSFAIHAPDGTGIDYAAVAGETASWKAGSLIVDNGSAFDGIYIDNNGVIGDPRVNKTYFIAQDSVKGVITNQVSVEESLPEGFNVQQNSPNPFNPVTKISFTMPEADYATIDVFNVTGQKVDTITNDFMSAGSHTVSWDASNFSAGVYFYTVKSGDFSKTMKMTLLK